MKRSLIIILLLVSALEVSAQRYEVINDLEYVYSEADSVEVGATVQQVKAYGDYYRVHLVVTNKSKVQSVEILTDKLSVMCGEGDTREVLDVVTFDKYMSKIRNRKLLMGDKSYLLDVDETSVFLIDEEDISSTMLERKRTAPFNTVSLSDLDRAYASRSTANYKLRVERAYMRSNTLKPRTGYSSFVMIKRGESEGTLTLDLELEGNIYRFEWNTDNISKVKYY